MQIAVVTAGGKVLTRRNSVPSSGKNLNHLNQLPVCQHLRLSHTVKGRTDRVCTGGALVH